MATLKNKINRILGDNVRLLLPSYWWKRLFGLVIDRIDEVENNTRITIDSELSKTSKNAVQNKVIKAYIDEKVANVEGSEIREFYIGESLTDVQKAWNLETRDLAVQNKCLTVYKIQTTDTALPQGTVLTQTNYLPGTNESIFNYARPTVGGSCLCVVVVDSSGNTIDNITTFELDAEVSATSTNAVQNKVVTAYIDAEVAKKQNTLISGTNIKTINGNNILGEGNIEIQGLVGPQGPQGERGPQGNSAFDGNGVEIVNNLTQGGEAAVLSAEQGKVLDGKLTELSEETDEKFHNVDSEIENLKRGEAYVMGETLTFRNYADATIIGNTLKL